MSKSNLSPKLVEALRLLASPAELQLSILPKYVHHSDELALIYDEAYQEAQQDSIIDQEWKSAHLLHILDRFFALKSQNDCAHFWTDNALVHDRDWRFVRWLARRVLKHNQLEVKEPVLDWIHFEKMGTN